MSNVLKIIVSVLLILLAVICTLFKSQRVKLDLYEKIHYMDSLNSERKDKLIQRQDSLIEALYEIKVTKIIIIEKDTTAL